MALITGIIPAQGFEVVRDRIGAILYDEMNNQATLQNNPKLQLSVSVERTNPIDATELATANVSTALGNYGNKNQGSVDGTYTYNLDFYTQAKTTAYKAGDESAAIILQRLMGIARAILENPIYNTLGFPRPFVSRTMVASLNIAETTKNDAKNVMMGRLAFTVLINENVLLKTPHLIDSFATTVKIANTEKGYFYERINY